RAQMRVDEVHTASAEWQESGVAEIEILTGRSGWERVWRRRICIRERVTEIRNLRCRIGCKWIEEQVGKPKEWRLPVVLQVVFGFQNVIEHAESTSKTGLAVPHRIPGEPEAWSPIVP